jgi:carbon storage regulator
MLVLTRKLREEIVVPNCSLTFTILEVHGDKVSIGISAPNEVRVYRREVWARILEEIKAQAAAAPPLAASASA